MPLTKIQKEALRNKISNVLRDNKACVLINQKKINSEDNRAIRLEARNNDTKYMLVKNSLTKIALRELGYASLMENLREQTAIVYSNNPFKAARISARAMIEFDEDIRFVGMIVDGVALDKQDLFAIARLKSKSDLYMLISTTVSYAMNSMSQLLQIIESRTEQ